MWRRITILLALAPFALASCSSTRVVIADPDRGIERGYTPAGLEGERSIRLQYDRVRLNTNEVIQAPPICYTCVDDVAEEGTVTFNLMFFAVNDTGAQWQLRANMFHLRREGAEPAAPVELRRDRPRPDAAAPHAGDADPVLASIAPYSTARIPVLFTVRDVDAQKPSSRVYGSYELRVLQESADDAFAVAGGSPPAHLLERHLAIGRFHQGAQALRFAGFFAVTLLVLGTL
jgi:hypothetical protein